MCGAELSLRVPASESLWRITSPLEASTGAVPEEEAKCPLLGKRATLPTAPMIVAARMGLMPKIWVRVVPEASTSASMRPLRSAIFRSSVRTSRSTSEANPRRRRTAAPSLGRIPRRMRAARSAESFPTTPPGRRSRKSACRRFSALVRSATRSSRLSESRRSASDAASGSTAASLSLREAASAVARASTPSFLRALPAKLESTLTLAESLGGTSTTDSPAAANLPARCLPRGHRRSPPLRAPLCEPSRPAFEGPKAGTVLRETGALEELASGFVDRSDGYPEPLWGSTPIKTFMSAHAPPFRWDLRHRLARRTFRLRVLCSHTSFESLRAGHRRDASLEQANPSYGRQGVRERSLYRHPKSLAAADHQAPGWS